MSKMDYSEIMENYSYLYQATQKDTNTAPAKYFSSGYFMTSVGLNLALLLTVPLVGGLTAASFFVSVVARAGGDKKSGYQTEKTLATIGMNSQTRLFYPFLKGILYASWQTLGRPVAYAGLTLAFLTDILSIPCKFAARLAAPAYRAREKIKRTKLQNGVHSLFWSLRLISPDVKDMRDRIDTQTLTNYHLGHIRRRNKRLLAIKDQKDAKRLLDLK